MPTFVYFQQNQSPISRAEHLLPSFARNEWRALYDDQECKHNLLLAMLHRCINTDKLAEGAKQDLHAVLLIWLHKRLTPGFPASWIFASLNGQDILQVSIEVPSIKATLSDREFDLITSIAGDNFKEEQQLPKAALWLEQYLLKTEGGDDEEAEIDRPGGFR